MQHNTDKLLALVGGACYKAVTSVRREACFEASYFSHVERMVGFNQSI